MRNSGGHRYTHCTSHQSHHLQFDITTFDWLMLVFLGFDSFSKLWTNKFVRRKKKERAGGRQMGSKDSGPGKISCCWHYWSNQSECDRSWVFHMQEAGLVHRVSETNIALFKMTFKLTSWFLRQDCPGFSIFGKRLNGAVFDIKKTLWYKILALIRSPTCWTYSKETAIKL